VNIILSKQTWPEIAGRNSVAE